MSSIFRDEIATSLRAGIPLRALVEIVQRHRANGLSQQAAYEILESIWTEHGCEALGEEESMFCGLLGGLMDRVWGYCNSKDAIWETSLQSTCNPPTAKT